MTPNIAVAYVFGCLSFFFLLFYIYKNHRLQNENNKLKDDYLLLAEKRGYFIPKKSYIRKDEKVLFDILSSLYKDTYIIIPQAKLSDLIDIKPGYRDHDNLYHVIGLKSVDFLLIRPSDMKPMLAIELNGQIHNSPNQKVKDGVKEVVFRSAEIPLLSISKSYHYDIKDIKNQVDEKLASTNSVKEMS